jgi:hypothetical protein
LAVAFTKNGRLSNTYIGSQYHVQGSKVLRSNEEMIGLDLGAGTDQQERNNVVIDDDDDDKITEHG